MALSTLMALLALAQTPAPSDVAPMNRRSFTIPIVIEQARRADIKQLILYVSMDEGKEWNQVAVATSDKTAFPFNAPRDGIYWFSVGVVDQQGKQTPLSPYQVPPAQKVQVDTEKPIVRILTADRQGDDAVVTWEIQEDQPDMASLKMEYRPADSQSSFGPWTMVPLGAPTLRGETRFRLNGPAAVAVRLELKDKVDNLGTATKEIPAGAAPLTQQITGAPLVAPAGALSTPGGVTAGTVGATTAGTQVQPPAVMPPATMGNGATASLGSNPPATNSGGWATQPTNPAGVDPRQPYNGAPMDQRPYGGQPTTGYAPTTGYPPNGVPAPTADGNRIIAATTTDQSNYSPVSAVPPANGGGYGPLPPTQIVNDPTIALEYEVTQYGPSGVSKVALHITRDEGRTWQYLTDDADCKSPIVATLPGEGIYGLRIVFQSGLGLTKGPPLAGEAPDLRIEVDTTMPVVELYEPKPDGQRRDTLTISWRATDRNLTAKPITLEWAERPDGQWQPIAGDLPNSGTFSWLLPAKIPYRVYLRAIAVDTAGNRSTAETREPIPVDLTKPAGRITGIASGGRRP